MIDLLDNFGGQSHALSIARYGKQSLFRARVIESLHRRAQEILRDNRADLTRSGLLNRVRFVQNQKIVRKEKSAFTFHLLLGASEEHEKERVIDDDDLRVLEFPPGALIKAAIALSTRFLRTNVGLATNLCPNFCVRFKRQITQRAVSCSRRPRSNLLQLVLLRRGEEIVLLLARAQKPARTNIILPAFNQRCLERLWENFLQNRNVFVEKLLL